MRRALVIASISEGPEDTSGGGRGGKKGRGAREEKEKERKRRKSRRRRKDRMTKEGEMINGAIIREVRACKWRYGPLLSS